MFLQHLDAPYQRALDDCFDAIICLLLGCFLSTSFGRLFWYNHLFITGMLLIDCFDTIICLLLGCSLSTSFGRLFWYNHLFITGMLLINELWTIVLIQSFCLLLGCSLSTSFGRLFWYNAIFVYYWDARLFWYNHLFINELWTIVLIQSFVYYWDASYQRALDDCFDTIICLLLGCSLSTSFGRLFWCNHLFITGMLLINELWTIVLMQSFVYYWDAPYQRALDDCFDTIICLLLGCSLSTSFRRLFWCNHLFITGMLLINELWTIVLMQSFVYYWDILSTSFGRLFWYNHLFITGMLLINELWTIVLMQSFVYYWDAYQRALDVFVLIQSFVYYWDAPYQRALDDCFDAIICLLLGCSLSTSFGRLFWCNHLFITGMLLINELWTIVLIQSFVYYWDASYQRALDDCFDTIICLLLGCSLSTSFGRLFWYNHLFITGMLLINEL